MGLPATRSVAGSAALHARRLGAKLLGSAFLWPMLVLVGAVMFWPIITTILHSFTNWQPGYPSPFVGFKNYTEVLSSSVFHTVAKNEAIFAIGVPLWTGVPLVVALILYEGVPAAGLFRTILFFPSILSPVMLGILFNALLRPDGLLNATLRSVGLGSLAHSWIDSAGFVKPIIIIVVMWYSMGFGVVLYSAALSAVPMELFEAAEIDGASWFAKLRYIMIPAIMPMVILNTVFSVASIFLLFGYVYVLTQGGPGYASTTIDYDIYQQSMSYGNFGYAAAEAALVLIVMAVLLIVATRIGKRVYVYG